MGYCYQDGKLVCDQCGGIGGVRRRACTHKILLASFRQSQRHLLPYCPAPALCGPCLKTLGGTRAVHARCAPGAAASQAEQDRVQTLAESGAFIRTSAVGSWHDDVPAGKVLVTFHDQAGVEVDYLVDQAEYEAGGCGTVTTVADYPSATFVRASEKV